MNRMKKRIATLIFAIIAAGLSILNFCICAKKVIAYDDLCNTTRNYEAYSNIRGLYTLAFILFLCISIYLIYMIFKYRGRLYDKWFRSYKVVGFIDEYNLDENFVQVIFKRKGKYYIQDDCYEATGNLGTIKRFIPLVDEDIDRIQPLSIFEKTTVIIGDKIILAYKYEDEIVIDKYDKMKKTLSDPEYGFDIEFIY